MIETVKQPNNWSCMACVAAMVAGEPLKSVTDFIGHDGSEIDKGSKHPDKRRGFNAYEIDSYLLSRGYSFAPELAVSNQDEVLKGERVLCEIDMGQPMYVSVKSKSLSGCEHAIYWDGKNVHDPNVDMNGELQLKDYELIGVCLVHKYKQDDVVRWRRETNV